MWSKLKISNNIPPIMYLELHYQFSKFTIHVDLTLVLYIKHCTITTSHHIWYPKFKIQHVKVIVEASNKYTIFNIK